MKLLIFSGPSGSGKTTIGHHLLSVIPSLGFSVSATTRAIRSNEKNGVDYYFLSKEDFKNKIEKNEFLEWEEVYKDIFYGTLKSEVERIWSQNKHIIFDIDVAGGMNIKKIYTDLALAVFVMPPSIDKLKERLKTRATETEESFKKRIEKAEQELTYAKQFDKTIINNNLENSFKDAEKITLEFLKK